MISFDLPYAIKGRGCAGTSTTAHRLAHTNVTQIIRGHRHVLSVLHRNEYDTPCIVHDVGICGAMRRPVTHDTPSIRS